MTSPEFINKLEKLTGVFYLEADKNISGFTSKDNLITGKSQAKDTGTEIQLEKWIENY